MGMSLACLRDRKNQGGPSVVNDDSGVTVISELRGPEAQNLADQARSLGSVMDPVDTTGVSDGLAGPIHVSGSSCRLLCGLGVDGAFEHCSQASFS